MKAFIKGCLITALVFVVVGIVLLVVAAAGGVTRASLKLMSDHGALHYGPVSIFLDDGFSMQVNGGNYTISTWEQPEGDEYDVSVGDVKLICDGDGDYFIGRNTSKDVFQSFSTGIDSLCLDAAAGEYEIRQSEDQNIYVEAYAEQFRITLDKGELEIAPVEKAGVGVDFSMDSRAVIYVPQDYCFKELELEVAAGSLVVDTPMSALEMDISVGVGNLEINQMVTANKMDIEVGAGNLEGGGTLWANRLLDMEVAAGNIDLDSIHCEGLLKTECATGNLELAGEVFDDIQVECSLGCVDLDLIGSEKKYEYQIHTGVGSVVLNGNSYVGIDSKLTISGDKGAPVAQLSCDVGEILLDLQ